MPDFLDVLSLRFSATLPQALAGLVVVAVSWVLARFVGATVMRLQASVAADHKELVGLLADVVGWCIFVVGIVAGLGTAGVNVTALVTGLGLTGFAIGFALKDILANAVAGILILMFRPYGRGDRVRLDKHQGKVAKIDLRYTTLDGPEGKILIPNAKAYTEIVMVLSDEEAVEEPQKQGVAEVELPMPQPVPQPQVQKAPQPQAAAPALKVQTAAPKPQAAPPKPQPAAPKPQVAQQATPTTAPQLRTKSTPVKRG